LATIQIRVDDDIKQATDSLFSGLGLDTSTAVRMFLAAALEHDGIPFAVKHRKFNHETLEAIEDSRLRRNLQGPYTTVDEAMKALEEE
jgi:DNA-damage-inducible protein J